MSLHINSDMKQGNIILHHPVQHNLLEKATDLDDLQATFPSTELWLFNLNVSQHQILTTCFDQNGHHYVLKVVVDGNGYVVTNFSILSHLRIP
jgi:hypothetical protein